VILVYRGSIEVFDGMNKSEYGPGVFIAESEAIMKSGKAKLEVKTKTVCDVFSIKAQDFHAFLEANPKLLVIFLANEVIL
jgi:CRP-like cAMP-binding protein